MIKYLILVFLTFFSITFGETVLVSIAPYRHFVKKIAKEKVEVDIVVPAGASSHTFEPTPKQMIRAENAKIWFQVGEGFEKKMTKAIKSHHPDLEIVDLTENIDLIRANCHHHDCYDLHIWLSPRLAKEQANIIAQSLIEKFPQYREEFQKNLKNFQNELDQLDQVITEIFSSNSNNTLMVSHPAYAYLARDYGLTQYAIEFEGKDPTPQQLTSILKKAKELKLKKIFIQPQHSSKGARLIAEQVGAQIVILDPYSEDYQENLKKIARDIAEK